MESRHFETIRKHTHIPILAHIGKWAKHEKEKDAVATKTNEHSLKTFFLVTLVMLKNNGHSFETEQCRMNETNKQHLWIETLTKINTRTHCELVHNRHLRFFYCNFFSNNLFAVERALLCSYNGINILKCARDMFVT